MPALHWALLVASALFNVVLFVRHASPASKRGAADTAVVDESSVAPGGSQRPATSEISPDLRRSSAECENTLLPLEAEVDALSIELRRRLAMPRLFALGEPNPDAEQIFRPIIEKIFTEVLAAEPATSGRTPPPYTLECHDIVCQLTFIAKTATASALVGTALTGDVDLRRRVTALSFPQSRSTEDILTKTSVSEAKVFWRVSEADAGLTRP
jgi:hypothetical protein